MKKITINDIAKEPAAMTSGPDPDAKVYRQLIFQPGDSNDFNFGIVYFDAGSRNKFHKHSGDQILVITDGTGKVATDSEVVTVTQGDVVLIPARENHWHGAPDNTSMAHITITVAGSETEQTEP